jgi:hypothetical protein
VDTLGNSFWSNVFQQADTKITIPQGQAIVQVLRNGAAVKGAKIYLFDNSGAYLGRVVTTEADGRAGFILPSRAFKFRVNEGADQIWSDIVAVPAGASVEATVDLD